MKIPAEDTLVIGPAQAAEMKRRMVSQTNMKKIVDEILKAADVPDHGYMLFPEGLNWVVRLLDGTEEVPEELKSKLAHLGYPLVRREKLEVDGGAYINKAYYGFVVPDRTTGSMLTAFLTTPAGRRIVATMAVAFTLGGAMLVLANFRGKM